MVSGFADIDVIMGAPNALNGDVEGERGSGMARKTRGKSSSAASDANEADINTGIAINSKKKRKMPGDSEKVCAARKMPKRAAACSDFREKPLLLSDKSSVIETKRGIIVEDEIAALHMTSVQDGPRPNRRLTNFIFHDSDGKPQPVEMLEVNDLFISGLILPLEESSDKDKERGIRCEGFGRIESWAISGYEEGSPVIWVSTDAADYDCVKPANNYKKPFSLFFEKARACIEVYKKLRASGGNPDQTVDELLAGVARSMSGNKNFPHQMSIKDFIASQGEFIYNQLISLDETSMKSDEIFRGLPVLVALRDEVKKYEGLEPANGTAFGNVMDKSLRIGSGEQVNHSSSSSCLPEEDEDMKLARVLQEEENWQSKLKKNRGPIAQLNKFYIKINEDEIANDYPLPAYYTSFDEEADEFLIFDLDTDDPDHLPKSMLNNWTLYNSDSRLISLELLPMKPCADIDVTVFGSGLMMEDDGSGFNIDANTTQSASGSAGVQNADGMPIYLSAIKEWTIEYGHGMIFIFIRTDLAWYRLGKPSKQYAPWYKPVLKAARLTVSLITLLEEQIRSSRISFDNVVRKISEFDKDHPAFISSNLAAVERYLVVHGPIILQQLSEYPGPIKNCAFVTALRNKMEERHHTKWLVKKKAQLKTEVNMNPRAAMTPTVSKRKAMPATTTRLINSIWGEFYSNYSPEDTKEVDSPDVKESDEVEDEQEEVEDDSEEVGEEIIQLDEEMEKPQCSLKLTKLQGTDEDLRWNGESVGKTSAGGALYMQAIVHGDRVAVGDTVLVETVDSENFPIYFVEYMFENSDARKMIHGRLMLRGSQTVLGKAGNEREVFLTNDCLEFELDDIKQTVVMETQAIPWGYQHRKANALKEKMDRERHEDRKRKGLPTEFFCKSFYCPERGAFFCLPNSTMGLGTGLCHSCKMKESQREKEMFKLNLPGFSFKGIEYRIQDFVYLGPCHLVADSGEHETFKSGRNVGLSAYVVGQLIDIEVPKGSRLASPESTKVKVRRFFRPEDVSPEKAYCSDIREVYYSDQIMMVPIVAIEGKCDVQKKHELPLVDGPTIVEHVFYCEHLYDPDTGAVRQLPANIKLSPSKEKVAHEAVSRKKKGKCKESENDINIDNEEKARNTFCMDRLATLDIFAGCGGLSEGLQKAGASVTKWAIEYEEPAGEAFKLNHPESFMFIHNCNVILRAIMEASGDADDCVSTSEAAELAAKLDESMIKNLPRPGEVDFINGGPPCQGFSGMNRFNQSSWSKVQCEMILAFLSFVDYFRPKFFLLENVRNFVSFNKGQTFRLTLASLLAIGYQVRFGVLEAGAYGVAQSRKRAFIWAAAPGENLPEWPEPLHVFASPELKVALSGNTHYAAVRSTVNGAPFRSITVKDTIGDLPVVDNGASKTTMGYGTKPESWFQKVIRGDSMALTDHVSKEMNELNLIRCKRIPRRPGADWRDLPDEKVKLSTGQVVDLIPWCLPNTAKRHNQWKGLFGRLDWKGNFPTSVTDPQPMGKVGMCFHPEQDRIVTVRECARSQGFPDTYKFAGNIQHKHRQIGNAVPPPLAYALGRKLKEAVESKGSR